MDERGLDDFLAEVEYVKNEVTALVKGETDVEKSLAREKQRKAVEEVKRREAEQKAQEEEERLARGVQGKGEKFDTYESFCPHCFLEFKWFREMCYACGRKCITSEERKQHLMRKVEELKQERTLRAEKKVKWENWKKTQSMLYKKTSTNYKKWDYFVDDDEEEEELPFVPPTNDPNFKALEDDVKERAAKRKADLKEAETLKEEGNKFFREGKFRNALLKYEAAQEKKKDFMILYTNSAIARIKLEDFEGAVKDCTRVLEYCEIFEEGYEKSKDVCFKALTRRGEARRNLGLKLEAIEDFEQALDLRHSADIEGLLERTRQEADVLGIEPRELEVTNAEEVMAQLTSSDQILGFIHSSGCVTLFKRVFESKDSEALKVLEFLFQDEQNYRQLRPLLAKVYDKRRIGATVLFEAIEKYSEDQEWVARIARLLWQSLENTHIREELMKFTAGTKGKKVTVAALNLFLVTTSPPLKVSVASIMSNLCLSKFKSAFERSPNPGNMKAVIRHRWTEFAPRLIEMIEDPGTVIEGFGLLCNISTDPKLKLMCLDLDAVTKKVIERAQVGTNSLEIERALGYLVNACTNPTKFESLHPHLDGIITAVKRLATLAQSTSDIEYRTYLLLFRLLLLKPEFAGDLAQNEEVLAVIFNALDTRTDIAVKIVTAGSSSQEFSQKVPIEKLVNLALMMSNRMLAKEKVDECVGNLALAIGKIAQYMPSQAHLFKVVVEPFVKIVKEVLGPVRKNVAVCLGKLADNPENREELRRTHGIEVLQSIMNHLG